MPCPCCQCSCNRTITYGNADSVPPGKTWADCPQVGQCGGTLGDCAGNVLEGFIVERFRKSCVGDSQIRAKLKAGSTVDNYGSVGSASTPSTCGVLNSFTEDYDLTDDVVTEDDGDFIKAKIPISITNDDTGGPNGLASVTICWCCNTGSDCNTCFPPPPVCCCDDEGNGTLDTTGSCTGTTFEPPATFDYSTVLDSLVIEWCGLTINGPSGYDSQAMDLVRCAVSTAGTEYEGRSAYLKITSKAIYASYPYYGSGDYQSACGFRATIGVTVVMISNVHVVFDEYPGWEPVWYYANQVEYYFVYIRGCNNGTSPEIIVESPIIPPGTNPCGDPVGCYQPCNNTPPEVGFVAAP